MIAENIMIAEKIKKDINDEFANLKEALQIHLKPNFDVSQTKNFLQTHIPKEIIYKSEILLDTLLNYLMEDARERIKNTDIKLQNAFFDADFRKRVHEWTRQLGNNLALEPDIVKYTFDPQLKQGIILGGASFVAGSLATGVIASNAKTITMAAGGAIVSWNPYVVASVIVAGMVTISLSALAVKIAHDKASPKAREIVKMDIDQFLAESQKQVTAWMGKVNVAFEHDFHNFCSTNGFVLQEKLNG